jgi:zinc protease
MNRYGAAASLLLGVLGLAATPLRVARAAPAPTTLTLRNGLRLVLAPDSSATALDVSVWYANGARTEPAGMTGVRHLVERQMVRGDGGAPVRAILNEGGTAGSATTPDYLCLWETVPAEALGAVLRLEAARMSPAATAGLDDARRMAIGDARARAARPPIARAVLRLGALAFEGTPYALASEGDEGALAAMTDRQVDAWRRDHLSPANAVVTVAGRFDPVAAQAAARAAFEPLPRGAAPAPAAPAMKPQAAERRVTERFDTPARLMVMGWRAPGAGDPDGPAAELLAAALGTGEDDRLPSAMVRDWKLALAAQAGVDRRADASLVWAVTALDADADSSTAERVLLDMTGALVREPLSDADFARVRERFVTNEYFRQQTARQRGQAIGEGAVTQRDAGAAARRLAALEKLTAADLQRVAARVFAPAGRTILWLVPSEGAAR